MQKPEGHPSQEVQKTSEDCRATVQKSMNRLNLCIIDFLFIKTIMFTNSFSYFIKHPTLSANKIKDKGH